MRIDISGEKYRIFNTLSAQWSKNNIYPLSHYSYGSNFKGFWVCKRSHEWEATIKSRVSGNSCPYCSNQKVLVGYNDLPTTHPECVLIWDFKKNDLLNISINEVTYGSNRKVWWICEKSHEYFISIKEKIGSQKCRICSNKKILVGYNDLATTHPHLQDFWAEENVISMKDVTSGSGKRVIWICSENHKWNELIYKISKGNEFCPYCSNRRLLVGYNDLATTHPHILKFWDSSNKIDPTEVSAGMGLMLNWKCEKGHIWKAPLYVVTYGSGCSYCSNMKVLKGYNDLATTNSDLADEWDFKRNKINSPETVTSGSSKSAWWICMSNPEHIWKAIIKDRNKGNGCPHCSKIVSRGEFELRKFLKTIVPQHEMIYNSRKIIKPLELDIYIPALKVAIEYNGIYWHSTAKKNNNNYHYNKWKMCQKLGIQLIQIWQDDWNYKKDIIQNMISQQLNSMSSSRNNSVISISENEAEIKKFYDKFHLHGFTKADIHLTKKNEIGIIEACLSLLQLDSGNYEITRFASNNELSKDFSDLFSNFIKFSSCMKVYGISDNCFSTENIYINNNFSVDQIFPPEYMHLYKNRREYCPEVYYKDKSISPICLTPKIYNAGKIKYVWVKC